MPGTTGRRGRKRPRPASSCVPGLLAEHARVDAQQPERALVALLDRGVEDDLRRGVDVEPAVAPELFLELAGRPAAVAERDQHAARAGTLCHRLEDVLAGGHLEPARHRQRRAERARTVDLALVQHEAALGLDRAAVEDRLLAELGAV